MSKAQIRIQLTSYWHVGTGKGGGPGVDARVALDGAGLPYLSGRALKGLVREALAVGGTLGHLAIAPADVLQWLGTDIPRDQNTSEPDAADFQERARFRTRPGQLSFTNARIPRDAQQARTWRAWAQAHPDAVAQLRQDIASTRISGDGTAHDQTLRAIEIAVPVTLWSTVEGPAQALQTIKRVLPLLRSVGAHRTRGLGRASFDLQEVNDA